MMQKRLGDYAKIVNDQVAPVLNGLIGKVIEIYEYNGETFYKVKADNYGPNMPGKFLGTRKVKAWLAGNVRSVRPKDCQ